MTAEDWGDIIRAYADDGKVCGVYLANPTGEVLDTDGTFIEVKLYDKSVFAKPCMSFGSFSVPNKEWLAKYKDEISVWLSFENGNPAHPVYLGICPRDGKTPTGNYPNTSEFKTVEFKEVFDDTDKKYSLEKVSEGLAKHGIYLEEEALILEDTKGNTLNFNYMSSTIKLTNNKGNGIIINDFTILGKGTGVASAVLGETLVSLLSQTLVATTGVIGIISGVQTLLASSTVIVNPATYIGTFNPATIQGVATSVQAMTSIVTTLTTIQGALTTALSKNVKLD